MRTTGQNWPRTAADTRATQALTQSTTRSLESTIYPEFDMGTEAHAGEKSVQVTARLLIALLFLYSGIGKILAPSVIIGAITHVGLPLPQVCYVGAIVLELGVSLCFVFGFRTRTAALVLGAYCVLTGILFHFEPSNPQQTIQLLKNLAITGGLVPYVFAVRSLVPTGQPAGAGTAGRA
jgi:putative oxidoreductase